VSETVWLASYPKSGNTWLRMLIGCLALRDGETLDINETLERGGIASARAPFDDLTLIDSGLLTLDEIDRLRPRVYEALARGEDEDPLEAPPDEARLRFVKVHDAYTLAPSGEALLAGARGAKGAIVLVRDPRDVAPSLANHNGLTLDAAIDLMNDKAAAYGNKTDRQHRQFRQKLPGWSGHVASWLDQRDIPVHLLRYEDLKSDTVEALLGAMAFAGRPITREEAERAARLAEFSRLQDQERKVGFAEASRKGTKFFRRGEAGAWRGELTAEQAGRIEAAHGAMMARLGYELTAAAELARAV
jgi:aryl sulfotransferase